ncbi:LytR C-terminal domain-containing protein [Gleimia sp. 6138-11-ORH1]|uniref:LytR C-terminal domain-containing protein n=1 Tax=Gleimia sp. 6138-11-ORH1 TaxID=2973937 RepID=UPI002169E8B1|nr:LytR C-terminal domain-containing protein [Gleimia sp. 6138-11-ORH1]MCS4484770.1 LytR C-terminal domain-containing protein [Gleimia sp. 6138-11-ORH1]
MNTQYPEDEFDEAGKQYPVGAYREAPSKWKAVLPFLLVLLLAPLLAWAAVSLLTSGSQNQANQSATNPSASQKSGQTAEKTAEQKAAEEKAAADKAAADKAAADKAAEEKAAAEKEAAEKAAAEKAAAEVKKDTAVVVLNGTNVNGLAGGAVTKLQAAGFSNLRPDNAQGWQTQVSTVYFQAGNESTAKAVGEALGISNVVESADSIEAVTVVLKNDYQP